MDGTPGRAAELGGPIRTINLKVLHGGGRNAEPLIELLEHVVVDQGQADVFVAAPLALLGVHLAEQVEPCSIRSIRRGDRASFAFGPFLIERFRELFRDL